MKRRAFIQATAISGVGALIVAKGAVVKGYTANEKLNVALVGVGGRGQVFVDTIPEYDNVVAMCDCDDQKAAAPSTDCLTCRSSVISAGCWIRWVIRLMRLRSEFPIATTP